LGGLFRFVQKLNALYFSHTGFFLHAKCCPVFFWLFSAFSLGENMGQKMHSVSSAAFCSKQKTKETYCG